MKHGQARLSKEARRKVRRWSFKGLIQKPEGVFGKHMPGVFFGTAAEADEVAARMRETFMAQEGANPSVVVSPVPHETVSIETRNQIDQLNSQAALVARAAFILAEKHRLSIGRLDATAGDLVKEAIDEATGLARTSQSDTVPVVEPEPIEQEPKPERRRGIDEFNRILNEPVSA